MKTKITIVLGISFLLALECGNLFAQSTQTTDKTSNITAPNVACSPVSANNADVLVVTGKIIDADTKQPIKNAKINFDKFGDELLHASIDDNGNYAIALNKKELGEPIRLIFKIAGYKRFAIKNIDKSVTHVDADLSLQPDGSDSKSNAKVKYVMDDSPFNTMVIKM
jgi:hypothetical protein